VESAKLESLCIVNLHDASGDPVFGHAIDKSGDAESDVGGGGTVLVFG
jgi:hypothetical protein